MSSGVRRCLLWLVSALVVTGWWVGLCHIWYFLDGPRAVAGSLTRSPVPRTKVVQGAVAVTCHPRRAAEARGERLVRRVRGERQLDGDGRVRGGGPVEVAPAGLDVTAAGWRWPSRMAMSERAEVGSRRCDGGLDVTAAGWRWLSGETLELSKGAQLAGCCDGGARWRLALRRRRAMATGLAMVERRDASLSEGARLAGAMEARLISRCWLVQLRRAMAAGLATEASDGGWPCDGRAARRFLSEGARLAGDGGATIAGAIVVITQRCFAAALTGPLPKRMHRRDTGLKGEGGKIAPTHASHRGRSCQDLDRVTCLCQIGSADPSLGRGAVPPFTQLLACFSSRPT